MAYKYSVGKRKFDDITAEGDAQGNTKIDFDEDYIALVASGSSVLVVSGSSRVGIGTTTPDYTLDVAGDIKVFGDDVRIKIDGDTDSHSLGSIAVQAIAICILKLGLFAEIRGVARRCCPEMWVAAVLN